MEKGAARRSINPTRCVTLSNRPPAANHCRFAAHFELRAAPNLKSGKENPDCRQTIIPKTIFQSTRLHEARLSLPVYKIRS